MVWKLQQLKIYSSRDIWKFLQIALKFWENFEMSLVV